MNPDMLGAFFYIACIAVTMFFVGRMKRRKLVYILDYQSGVDFSDGASGRILPAGVYWSRDGGTSITIIDMRPYQFIIERLFYQNALLARSVISVGGEVVVRDPQRFVGTMKDLMQDSLPKIREGIKLVASRSLVEQSIEGKTKLADDIASELNHDFEPNGLEIRNLEITELWAQPIKVEAEPIAN